VSLVYRTVTKVDPSVSEKKKAIREKIEPDILKLEESIKPAIEQLEKEAKEQGLIVEEQVKNLRFTKAK
jgi:gas vesicle protein